MHWRSASTLNAIPAERKWITRSLRPDTFVRAMEKLKLKPEDCLIVEDSTNGGKAAAAAGTKCVWFHNPDSGDQQIPHAVLEIASWSQENVEKIIELMKQ